MGAEDSSRRPEEDDFDDDRAEGDDGALCGDDSSSSAKKGEERPPMVAFSNSRSGGGRGLEVLRSLQELLGPERVFDLGTYPHPEEVLAKHDAVTVIVCGGDGTMTWIMAAIDVVREKKALTCWIAPMPLGTGNDLARTFGWGGTFSKSFLTKKWLDEARNAEPANLDRWLVSVMPTNSVEENEPTLPEVFTVHEYDSRAVVHRVVSRGLHYSVAATGQSKSLLAVHEAEMRNSSYDRDFAEIIIQEEDQEDQGGKEEQEDQEDKEASASAQEEEEGGGKEEEEEEDLEEDRVSALVASHAAPSESALKAGATWRSYDGTFSNYLSVGLDAAGAFAFHAARRKNPRRFSSRVKNQLLYAWLGLLKTGGCCGCDGPPPLLKGVVHLLCRETPDGPWRKVDLPSHARGLIILNLQSYAGGRNLWGGRQQKHKKHHEEGGGGQGEHDKEQQPVPEAAPTEEEEATSSATSPSAPLPATSSSKRRQWRTPDVADGLLEVVTVSNIFNLACKLVTTNGLGGRAHRLVQAAELRLRITEPTYVQIDGEPWLQSSATVHIKAIGRGTVLRHESQAKGR